MGEGQAANALLVEVRKFCPPEGFRPLRGRECYRNEPFIG